jgi:subtilase family serine protease
VTTLRLFTRIIAVLAVLLIGFSRSAVAQTVWTGPRPIDLRHLGSLAPLRGSLLPRLVAAHRLGRLAPVRQLHIDVSLAIRDEPGLQAFLRDVYNPHAPQYHHFLTPAQFAARFATPAQHRSAIAAWLRSRGLRVTGASRNGLLLQASGSVRAVGAAFGTSFYSYSLNGRHFYSNAGAIRVPQALLPDVTTVSGLDSFPQLRPMGLRRLRSHVALQSVDGFSPSDIQNAYDLNPLYGAGVNGSGQSIALQEYDDYQQSNIDTYDRHFGLNPPLPERISVPVNGDNPQMSDGQTEVELDIEVAQAIAPAAHLLVYESPNSTGTEVPQLDRILSDNRAKVVSTSWGLPEDQERSSDLHGYDQALQDAAAQGVSVFAASGDNGAYDDSHHSSQLAVDYPASDPWATGVGGTALDYSGSYGGESVWSHTNDNSGSGGGLSTKFQRPSYQQGPGIDNQYSNGMRQVPDVAADADPATGYAIYAVDTQSSNTRPHWVVLGGTSAASPLWAAYTALLDQSLNASMGFMNPTLYSLASRAGSLQYVPFHDVTQGDNLYYAATPGWDYGTGLGSMDGTALLDDIKQVGGPVPGPTPNPQPTPAPTSQPSQNVAYHLIVRWEKPGSTMASSGLSRSRQGKKVQYVVYIVADKAPAGLPVSVSYLLTRGNTVVKRGSQTGSLTDGTGVYRLSFTYKPTKPGFYTFTPKVTAADRTLVRSASLTVTH